MQQREAAQILQHHAMHQPGRTWGTSMGGLYVAATLLVLLLSFAGSHPGSLKSALVTNKALVPSEVPRSAVVLSATPWLARLSCYSVTVRQMQGEAQLCGAITMAAM